MPDAEDLAMADSSAPYPGSDGPAPASVPPGAAPVDGPASPHLPGPAGNAAPAKRPSSGARRAAWLGTAAVWVAAGTIASILGARAVARNDANGTRESFQQSAAATASTAKLATRHEEQLTVSASTFFANRPHATAAEFDTWVNWARALRRYPELEQLGLVNVIPAAGLPAFEAQLAGLPVKPQKAGGKTSTIAPTTAPTALRITPAGARPFYCLTTVGLVRPPARHPPAGRDYCAEDPTLLATRGSGRSSYSLTGAGHGEALVIETPVYLGNETPATRAGRVGAFAGWVREVILPSVLMEQVLRGHDGEIVSLAYHKGASQLSFASGVPHPGAQSATTILHNGWTVTSYAAPVSSGVLSDGDATALLIGGIAASVLLGALVFLLGAGRGPSLPEGPKPGRCPTSTSTTPSPACPTAPSRSTGPSAWSHAPEDSRGCSRGPCTSTSTGSRTSTRSSAPPPATSS